MTSQSPGSAPDGVAAHARGADEADVHRPFTAAIPHLPHPPAANLSDMTSNELAEIRTSLAVDRTLMGADRTLMAWIRTALSLYSFGFTLYKLLEAYQQSGVDLPDGHTPRTIGLFLTGLGTCAMVMGVIEYWVTLRGLGSLKSVPAMRPTFLMGVFMAALGLFLFFSIITKLF